MKSESNSNQDAIFHYASESELVSKGEQIMHTHVKWNQTNKNKKTNKCPS